MVGCRKSVVTQLNEICSGSIGVHYIAHRSALARSEGVQLVLEMNDARLKQVFHTTI